MKKALSILLLTAMMLSAFACSGDNNEVQSDTSSLTEADSSSDTENTAPQSELPELDLGGITVTMLRSNQNFIEQGIYAAEQNGDPVNDAIFDRNSRIMENYNCVIFLQESSSLHPSADITTYVMSGDGTVDMLYDGGTFIAQTTKNYNDLNTMSYLDFEKPWWNNDFNKGITIDGKLFFTVGSHMTTARTNVYHVIFNKTVATDNGFDPAELYGHVYDDTWTLDKMIEYAESVKKDLNGDGKFDSNDLWGMIGEEYNSWTIALGSGFKFAEKDADDIPFITMGNEKNYNIMDKVMKLTANRDTSYMTNRMSESDIWATLRTMKTTSGRWLFLCGSLGDSMRTLEDDYGALPTPKFDESQERYYHDASVGNSPTTAIPISTDIPDETAFVLEAMCYDSYVNMLPIFYENYLNTKLARDEETVEMLKIVHDTLYYDIGALYNWGNMRMIIENMTNATENNLASSYASIEGTIKAALDETIEDVIG